MIEGELDYESNRLKVFNFIFKRSFVLILLSIFISKSFQAYVFDNIVSDKLKEYKVEYCKIIYYLTQVKI